MKIKFNPDLDFQREAIDAIIELFEGNPLCQSNFTVSVLYGQRGTFDSALGIGNRLDASFDETDILNNLQDIQLRNGLPQSLNIKRDQYYFTVEMETGTGKTYVYLRTAFELNKKYGFTKFIVVVPSVAIKEGVVKSVEMMREHFKLLYNNVPFTAFEYQSKNIEQIRAFATADTIQLMIMTVQSFNKDTNIINREHEKTDGFKPLEFIKETRPIVIVDEPQSTMSTKKAKDAVDSLNPLCSIGYSATHRDKQNMVFRLDAVDAYQRQLVKQIEVQSVSAEDNHNQAYMVLEKVKSTKTNLSAKMKIDVLERGKIKRKSVDLRKGTDLFELSGGREVYSGYIVQEIYAGKGEEYVDFTNGKFIRLGQTIGDIDDDARKRLQISKTIEEHLDKELRLNPKGIKVLSLFFIDRVENYRTYDEDGNPGKGKYARWFEETFKQLMKKPKYQSLLKDQNVDMLAESVHNGYFAKDKKGKLKDTRGNTLADEDAYNMIMKDKEKLLSFSSHLKFIFSHSALKEGWDNPNVFQICTLNETNSEIKKRQEIGRGLRIAVDQNGQRRHGFEINTLTVMANESYEDFAKKLQNELEEEEGIRFGVVEAHSFANITRKDTNGKPVYLNQKKSEEILEHLKDNAYVDDSGKVTDKLKVDLKTGDVSLPYGLEDCKPQILKTLKRIAGDLNIKNAETRLEVKLNKKRYLSPEFKALWEKIKHKTTYSVDYNSQKLIEQCVKKIDEELIVDHEKLIFSKATVKINEGGSVAEETERYGITVDSHYELPDILTFLQDETNLTRRTLVAILTNCTKLNAFKANPQKFMDDAARIIKTVLNQFIVDGVKYEKIGDTYAQELFENEELFGYLKRNMIESDKSVYDHVIYDSDNEAAFAAGLESNNRVKVYAKLPDWFKIETPIGTYNPDWAVLFEKDGEEHLYLVVETKGNIHDEALRPTEKMKIKCGEKHFEAIQTGVRFEKADDYNDFVVRL
ncbi:MAG: DEAD/DEAH box helicase family protein [Thermotogota bacterium]|nr:DEAD/DEAH box helicase family protein [Thermotogota bacterium]